MFYDKTRRHRRITRDKVHDIRTITEDKAVSYVMGQSKHYVSPDAMRFFGARIVGAWVFGKETDNDYLLLLEDLRNAPSDNVRARVSVWKRGDRFGLLDEYTGTRENALYKAFKVRSQWKKYGMLTMVSD